MQKAESQNAYAQNQPAVRQGKGMALDSPQREQIAQLEAMVESSPQVGKLAQLAAMANSSPAAAAQRRFVEASGGDPRMLVQRKIIDGIVNGSCATAQRQRLDDSWGGITYQDADVVRENEARGPIPSSGTVQLRKYKDRDIRVLVKQYAALNNSTAIQLAIYNEMRFEIDPTPPQFAAIGAATAKLIGAGRLDADDAEKIAAEAIRMQQAGGDPAVALRQRTVEAINAAKPAVEGAYAHHIFAGDTNGDGVPTGFHSKADGSATHETYGAATPLANGTYQQSVRLRIGGSKKPIQSTFFPDAASHDAVIGAIAAVYKVGLSTVAHVDPSVNGMSLAKRGSTVFPADGSDQRFAE